jgi:protein-disulfide isomerase
MRARGSAGLAALVAVAGGATAQEPLRAYSGPGITLGSAQAATTVIEFSDPACGACAQFTLDTWPRLRDRYVDTGRVRWIAIPFELGFRNSEEGVRAVYCAAEQGRFWEMRVALYRERAQWVGERRPHDGIRAVAVDAGLDRSTFADCYGSDDVEDAVDEANRAAHDAGVRGTPTFLIGGQPAPGALPYQTFVELIERAEGAAPPISPSSTPGSGRFARHDAKESTSPAPPPPRSRRQR